MNKDVLIAYAYDGMRHTYEKEVTSISVWINDKCGHQVNDESVSTLLKEVKESGKMQIYICDNKMDGEIDAFESTPLYTNGQFSVNELVYNGTVVWSRFSQFNIDMNELKVGDIVTFKTQSFPNAETYKGVVEYKEQLGLVVFVNGVQYEMRYAIDIRKTQNEENSIVIPRKLVHSGKKRAYSSSFVWDCPLCGHWNIWNTNMLIGKASVQCMKCLKPFVLDKSNPKEEIIRTKKMKSIID